MTSREHAPVLPAQDLRVTIDQLWVYPIKSCAGTRLPRARLLPHGLDGDRTWMVVDAEGQFVTQRDVPAMALVQPQLHGTDLVLTAPGLPALTVTPQATGPLCRATVWGDTVDAIDAGDAAAQWWHQALALLAPGLPDSVARGVRLVQFPAQPTQPRLSSKRWTHGQDVPNHFSDGFPVLVTSTASLAELNQRLATAGHAAVDMRRFRPNIVLGGTEAHDEDVLSRLTVAMPVVGAVSDGSGHTVAAELALTKPCARCPIPNIDPDTAVSAQAVSAVLQTYRADARLNGAVTFGMNAFATHLADGGVWLHEGQVVDAEWYFE